MQNIPSVVASIGTYPALVSAQQLDADTSFPFPSAYFTAAIVMQ